MIKKLVLASMFLLSIALPAQAQPRTNWVNIANFTNGNSLDVDFNSVQRSGSLVQYLTRMRTSYPDTNGAILTAYQEIANCDSGAYQTLAITAINQQRQIIFNQQYNNASVQAITLGSPRHEVYRLLCQTQNTESANERQAEAMIRAVSVDIPNSVANMVRAVNESAYRGNP